MRKAFVLLSGGMDSTTCLHQAIFDYAPDHLKGAISQPSTFFDEYGRNGRQVEWVEAFSVDYNQRHRKEMDYAKATCDRLGIKHSVLPVGSILAGKSVMLTNDSRGSVEVPDISYNDIKGVSPTYVPFRNGLMLSVLTAQAQKWVNEENVKYNEAVDHIALTGIGADIGEKPTAGVYFGAHAEDAHNWAYPDCTPEFIGAMANAIYIGTYHQVRLHTPIQWSAKSDVVTLGERLGVDWKSTWSCYRGDDKHCGVCPTCRARKEAFIAAAVQDPTEYAA